MVDGIQLGRMGQVVTLLSLPFLSRNVTSSFSRGIRTLRLVADTHVIVQIAKEWIDL